MTSGAPHAHAMVPVDPSSAGGWFSGLLRWFTGGSDHRYMDLVHCMGQDYLWIGITVALDLTVAAGYVLIARHWWVNQRHLPNIPAKRALANMRNIFLFCGLCGYLFIPVKMFWPAWRLYDLFLVVLAYFTWRYAWNASNLKVVYKELGRNRQLEQDLEKSREESRRKSFFLNAISHDLRTPLNGLMLQADLAKFHAAGGDTAAISVAVDEIKASARATANLLEGLLEYARLEWSDEQNVLSRFSLDAVLDDALIPIRSMARQKGLTLRGAAPTGLSIRTDRIKLERILSNLLCNAVKFTESGGVRLTVRQAEQTVEINVIDTGVGIDAAQQPRIFEEFFQVLNHERDRSKGYGLGLAIARRLAMQLGGELTVDSAPGRGSCFTLSLPHVVVAGDGGVVTGAGGADGSGGGAVAAPSSTTIG